MLITPNWLQANSMYQFWAIAFGSCAQVGGALRERRPNFSFTEEKYPTSLSTWHRWIGCGRNAAVINVNGKDQVDQLPVASSTTRRKHNKHDRRSFQKSESQHMVKKSTRQRQIIKLKPIWRRDEFTVEERNDRKNTKQKEKFSWNETRRKGR